MQPTFDQNPERLLEDVQWTRRLARLLVGDPQVAADLSQETWVRALREHGSGAVPDRGWLASMMRRLAYRGWRSERRRERRERRREVTEESPSTFELAARAEAQQRVARAVLELEEGARRILLLRFFEGLSNRDIARQMGVPQDTVRARTRRALAVLRARLESEGDDSWVVLAAPLLFEPAKAGAVPVATGSGWALLGIPMSIISKAGVAVVVGLIGWSVWLVRDETKPPAAAARVADGAEMPVRAGAGADAVPSAPPEAAENAQAVAGQRREVEAHAQGVTGKITFVYPNGREVSDADGRFQLRESRPDGTTIVTPVEVVRGEWHLPPGAHAEAPLETLLVERMVMEHGGEARSVPLPPMFDEGTADDVHWRCELEPVLRLFVRDAESGRELRDVEILDESMRQGMASLVSDKRRRSRSRFHGHSPIVLPLGGLGEPEDARYVGEGLEIGAPGYGWKSLFLAVGQDQEQTIELERAGELQILFEGSAASVDTELSLLRLDPPRGIQTGIGHDWEGFLDATDDVLLTGVPPGEYRVVVDLRRPRASGGERLGEARAEVVSGRRSVVRLHRDGVDVHPRVSVDGTVRIPPEWELDDFRLTMSPLDVGPTTDDVERVWTHADLPRDPSGVARLRIDSTPTGRYVMELVAFPIVAHREVIDIGPAGSATLEFRLPLPAQVRVVALDAKTREPVSLSSFLCGQVEREELAGERAFHVEIDPETGSPVAFRAPEGDVAIFFRRDGGHRQELVRRVEPGHNDWTILVD